MKQKSLLINSSVEGLPIARALARELRDFAETTVWAEAASQAGKTPLETLDAVASQVDAAAVVLTAGDIAVGREANPRQNLILEVGYLLGVLGRRRVFLVVPGSRSMELPSDLLGVVTLHYDARSHVVPNVTPVAAGVLRELAHIEARSRGEAYNCFVSYAAADREFSVRLTHDLEACGFTCWLDTKQDIAPGASWSDHIGRALEASDKVVLVLSRASVDSEWVKHETRRALVLERTRRTPFLIPLRLDDAVFESQAPEISVLRARQIADFREWSRPAVYKEAVADLVRGLMVSRGIEARGSR